MIPLSETGKLHDALPGIFKIPGGKVKNPMTAEELKAKRLALGFGCRNALATALEVNKYAVEHREYGR